MNDLHINLELSNNNEEHFRIDRNFMIDDNIFEVSNLSPNDQIAYTNFINLIGYNNVIITDLVLDEVINFNRLRLFNYDDNYNIIGIGSYIKSFNDFSIREKEIINTFLELILNL